MKRKVKKAAQRPARKAASKAKTARATKAAAKKTHAAPREAIDALVEAGARALGLPLDAAWHASVKFNLQLILRHAALVEEFSLPDDAEPAPVFHA
jgi:1-carboxybiuret hydrolase subunit AtzG-like